MVAVAWEIWALLIPQGGSWAINTLVSLFGLWSLANVSNLLPPTSTWEGRGDQHGSAFLGTEWCTARYTVDPQKPREDPSTPVAPLAQELTAQIVE